MPSPQHTPGPWEAYHTNGAGWGVRKQHERPGYKGLAPVCSMAWWQFDIPGIIDNDISEANARLIAAAPQMLEVLQMSLSVIHAQSHYGDNEDKDSWLEIERSMKDAIASACKK